MYNPSYLIRSRHAIYYFRYPLPTQRRVSVSLRTRCPKLARKLANALEHYSLILLNQVNISMMKHAEVKKLFQDYYRKRLDRLRLVMEDKGELTPSHVRYFEQKIDELSSTIDAGENDPDIAMGLDTLETEDTMLYQEIQSVAEANNIDLPADGEDYPQFEKEWKHAYLAYAQQALEISKGTPYNFGQLPQIQNQSHKIHRLGDVVRGYLNEVKADVKPSTFKTYTEKMDYLIELLGEDYNIVTLVDDDDMMRHVRESIMHTPSNRSKKILTRDKPLAEQITIAKDNDMEMLSLSTCEIYMTYIKGLFDWAKAMRYIEKNPFAGVKMSAKRNKNKQPKRDEISKDEIGHMLQILEQYKDKNPSCYWATMVSLYTGARRGEVSGLLASDVKTHPKTGLIYFDITDEEEKGKNTKTKAAIRIVPVHDDLIENGFLDFIEKSKRYLVKVPETTGYETRLFYDFTYTEGNQWGRKLGRFVNDKLLVEAKIKTKKKVLHSFRHSFISNLSRAGVEGGYIKSMAGHEQGTVTETDYTHYGIEHLQQFKKAIDKLKYQTD